MEKLPNEFEFMLSPECADGEGEDIVFTARLNGVKYDVTWQDDDLPMLDGGVDYTMFEAEEAVESGDWVVLI